jgi:iron complex transport system substrate-binding protein
MGRRWAISGLLAALLAASAVPAFAREATPAATPGGGPYAATDAVGRTVALEEPADRVVCLQVGCDEVMADLGLLPVASASSSALPRFGSPIFYGARAADVATVEDGGSVEAVAAFEPDLIYVAEVDDARDAMAAVAPVFVGHQFEDVAGYADNLLGMGALTGRAERAAEAVARFGGVVATIAARAPAAAANLRFLVLFGDPEVYRVALEEAQFCRILREHGLGRCAIEAPPLTVGDVTLPFADVDAEVILAADPDLIGIIDVEDASGATRTDPVWSRLRAVASGRVYGDPSLGM